MTENLALRLTSGLIGFSIALACLEYIFLITNNSIFKVWSFKNLESELYTSFPVPKKMIHFFFADQNFIIFVVVQMICAVSMIWSLNWILVLVVLLIQFLICIRFRGTFNGGSDFMTVVILTGLFISAINSNGLKWGLVYIAIHSLISYFKAGFVKAKNPEWTNGTALIEFFQRSPISSTKYLSEVLKNQKGFIQIFSILFIVFELSVPLAILFPILLPAYFSIAVLFHFSAYALFGLNRFFWVWLSTWPAIFFWALGLFK